MATRHDDRELGLHRRLPRRAFPTCGAVRVTGAGAGAAATPLPPLGAPGASAAAGGQPLAAAPTDYPPALTGLRGNYPASVEAFGPMRAGAYREFPAIQVDAREESALVIVGGGISGLAAAYFWRRALGNAPRILILDNHDDFGGHA